MTDAELSTWIADCSPFNGHLPALDGVPASVFLRLAERCERAEAEKNGLLRELNAWARVNARRPWQEVHHA